MAIDVNHVLNPKLKLESSNGSAQPFTNFLMRCDAVSIELAECQSQTSSMRSPFCNAANSLRSSCCPAADSADVPLS